MIKFTYFTRLHHVFLAKGSRFWAFAGRMLRHRKLLRQHKRMFWGIAIGIALTILVSEGWDSARNWWYSRGREKRMESRLQPPPFPRKAAVDYDWTIRTLDGRDFAMTAVRGKVVVLNFWATWCPPCIAEMPSLQRLYDALKDAGVVFIGISDEEPETVQKFVREKGYTFPIYTMEAERPEDFQSRGIPNTVILGKDGKIAFRHVGSAKWDDRTSIDFIKALL